MTRRNGTAATPAGARPRRKAAAKAPPQPPAPPASLTIGSYLIQRMQDYGIGHVFGIPGDFVLTFYGMLQDSPIEIIGTTREDNAGYAADAYARVHGLGMSA